jgi:hypothetical protein
LAVESQRVVRRADVGSSGTVSILVDFDATVNSRFSGLFGMPLIVRELPEIRTFWTAYPGDQKVLAHPGLSISLLREVAAHDLARPQRA